jgi:glycosyltransferase involved in cell wall biosynthesis
VSDLFFAVERRPEPETVLFAGLIIPRKGVVELVEAARRLHARRPGVRFRLAGAETDAAYASRVRAAIAEAGLPDVIELLGGLPAEALAREFARATLLVLPSFQETAPIAIQEAMAAAVPVVATDVGGNRHLVREGETGRLVLPGDADALAEALDSVMGDAARAAAMGAAAREEARARFAPLAVAQRSLALYQSVRSRRQG